VRSEVSPIRDQFGGSGRTSAAYLAFKAAAEWLAAAVLVIVTAPLMGLLALCVKRASPGPAFYSQIRLGLHGSRFRIWKFRTMVHNCEAHTGPVWASADDHRVTRIGRILRDTHLDELPQLWNVLRGEMSLIGPRPERPEIAERIEAAFPGFHRRLRVKPGLTGLAQLSLPADSDIANVPHKLTQDLYYVQHQGLVLDVRIACSTAFHFAAAACASASKILLTPVHSRRKAWEVSAAQRDPILTAQPHQHDRPVELSAAA
jgi:lipopolysaccharide/colanic/teichoic acid biosynthesis glycosyltransferase